MNILMILNNNYANYAVVMLTSLFLNNMDIQIDIYILYSDLDSNSKKKLQDTGRIYGQKIIFLKVNSTLLQEYPSLDRFPAECYILPLIYKFLPDNIDRILYLDADLIIEKELTEFYYLDFEGYCLVACGQILELLNGTYHKIGARPEKGQVFDCGVLLLNIDLIRTNISIQSYKKEKERSLNRINGYKAFINLLFEGKVKIISPRQYNFRIELFENYLNTGKEIREEIKPAIIHYAWFDYYHIGCKTKPWYFTLDAWEYGILRRMGVIRHYYMLDKAEKISRLMNQRWWYYAKKTNIYKELKEQLNEKKTQLINCKLEGSDLFHDVLRIQREKKKYKTFMHITKGRLKDISEIEEYRYYDLENYIDGIDVDSAIKTMRNLFSFVGRSIRKRKKAKVAFLVYSSSEWQCESIYRFMEKDERFEPWIVICAYVHGSRSFIGRTYASTCEYFRNRKKNYQIEYAGFCARKAPWRKIDEFDIIFYITPYNHAQIPDYVNMHARKITQLCVWIPYAIMLVDMSPYGSNNYFLDHTVVKLSWHNFCMEKSALEMVKKYQRLKGYNATLSGSPKIDELIDHSYDKRDSLWKTNDNTKYKIIWAPHFNMAKGMNGTFQENYKWFYQFAADHKELSWIVRPHPRMEWGVIEYHVFNQKNEYLEYLKMWDALPNAKVLSEGDYLDIFDTSDAMILDSISFRAEYQYTGKPMLILQSEYPRSMSKTEECLQKGIYIARGNDFESIERFIIEMIEKDPKKEIRRQLFKEWLDCRQETIKPASQFIFDTISTEIFG